jgi:hypothetical protein
MHRLHKAIDQGLTSHGEGHGFTDLCVKERRSGPQVLEFIHSTPFNFKLAYLTLLSFQNQVIDPLTPCFLFCWPVLLTWTVVLCQRVILPLSHPFSQATPCPLGGVPTALWLFCSRSEAAARAHAKPGRCMRGCRSWIRARWECRRPQSICRCRSRRRGFGCLRSVCWCVWNAPAQLATDPPAGGTVATYSLHTFASSSGRWPPTWIAPAVAPHGATYSCSFLLTTDEWDFLAVSVAANWIHKLKHSSYVASK